MEEDQWWLMPYVDKAVETLTNPRNFVDPVLWPEGFIGNQKGQGDFRLSDIPTSLLGLGRWPETGEEAYRRWVRPVSEFLTDTKSERAAKEAASQGGEAERRMRAIRLQSKPSYLKTQPVVDNKKEEKESDWLNQLLMASLMQGQKRQYGRQAGLGYGVGAQVPFGDPYTMRAAWEKDYRNI